MKIRDQAAYDAYWYFAAERQRMFFKRFRREAVPWTEDRTLQKFSFTNAYRASDRVSQHLISSVIPAGSQEPNEVFFRVMLFKIFNKIETWDLLTQTLGEAPSALHFNAEHYGNILREAMADGVTVYAGAYMMKGPARGGSKHEMHLGWLSEMIRKRFGEGLAEARHCQQAWFALTQWDGIGPFLAYQYATDLAYADCFRWGEGEFTCPGPGSGRGIARCFDLEGSEPRRAIEFMYARQGLDGKAAGFQNLWGRDLQLIDCQNIFCELDKYLALSADEGTHAGKRRQFRSGGARIVYRYPEKWGLNEKIQHEGKRGAA